jgi:lipopolysaccharide transport system ATP-binding protein
MSEAIVAEGISKLYRIGTRARYRTLRDAIADQFRRRKNGDRSILWALRDVSFNVRQGEALGIIGRNGAGKSTLLKILSRITPPTEGRIEITGQIGSLLEVGTGFHLELTGRENVYLSGAILGMKKRQIDEKFDEIVAFAEVQKFIDTPVKYYSSGMQVRLAFAVAAHLEPEIMLVDEVLAVGDASFQKKCLGKMGDVTTRGRTVLFVSHNLRAVAELCERCLWIEGGRIVGNGSPQEVILSYINSTQTTKSDGRISPELHRSDSTGSISFRTVRILDNEDHPKTDLSFGEPLRLTAEFDVLKKVEEVRLIVGIEKLDGTRVSYLHHTDDPSTHLLDLAPGRYVVSMEVNIPLMPGGYSIQLGAKESGYAGQYGRKNADWVDRAYDFFVEEFTATGQPIFPSGGLVRPASTWTVSKQQEDTS